MDLLRIPRSPFAIRRGLSRFEPGPDRNYRDASGFEPGPEGVEVRSAR